MLYCDTMIMVMLPKVYHPDVQEDDIVTLTTEDLEYIKTLDLVDDQSIYDSKPCLVVSHITDEVILGNLAIETSLEIQTGIFNYRDY